MTLIGGLTRMVAMVFVGLLPVVVTATGESADAPKNEYVASIEEWRQNRMEGLQRPTGWFSLVGLYWLDEGTSTVGADPDLDVVLPDGLADRRVGTLTVNGETVRFDVEQGVEVISNGEPVESLELNNDHHEEGPTVLEHRSLSWYVIKRGERLGLRVKDSNWASHRTFHAIEGYPIDPAWRVTARLDKSPVPRFIDVPDITGDVGRQPCPGALVFEVGGETYSLDPIAEPGASQYFIVFGDETNGTETYGAGRFLYADAPGDDGLVILDFNKAYNPPCAFTPYATCPLPPKQNALGLRVTAGEKKYADEHHE